MAKPDILQLSGFQPQDQQALEAAFTMHRHDGAAGAAEFPAKIASQIRGIAPRGIHRVTRSLIEACPKLEIIAVYGVGYDGVDIEACRERGVRVTNTPDVLTGDVADLGVAMMLTLSRQMVAAERWVKSGDWAEQGVFALSRRVHGGRAGILGLGRIGMAVARRLSGFDISVAYTDLAPRDDVTDCEFVPDPVELASRSDFLFVTLSATDETRHIVSSEVLSALGPEGLLINVSRAANVDEQALLDALESGELGGAALDVFEGEPHIDPRFLRLGNVLLQPHHASGTVETRRAMGKLMLDNLIAHFEGRPLLTPVPELRSAV